jgi:hypothetical protein
VWASLIVVLSIGGLALSVTTVAPMFRRLGRHGKRLTTVLRARYAAGGPGGNVVSKAPTTPTSL